MPSRFGFMLGMIMILIVAIVNIIIYPKLAPYLHKQIPDLRTAYEPRNKDRMRLCIVLLWLFSAIVIATILYMVFVMNI